MKTLIIDNHSKHLSELSQIFPNSEIITHESLSSHQDLSGFDLLIISGGSGIPTVSHHADYYAVEESVIRGSSIPVLGICLGAEIIVAAFGGELTEISTLHKGDMVLKATDQILAKAFHNQEIKVYEAHSVRTKQLPDEFIACAHSDHGIEIFRHTTKPIIGVQFHPEVGKHDDIWKWVLKTLGLEG